MDVLDAVDQQTDTDLDLGEFQHQDETPTDPPAKEQQAASEDKIDGRKFNPEWSKAFKEIRETRPEFADMLTKLRDTYGRYSALNELAPKGMDEVRGWKSTIDAVGGPEAAAEMMQRVATMEQIDARLASSDFSAIGELPEEIQKGVYGMVPDMLSTMQEKNPEAFKAAVMPHFSAALAGTGMIGHLEAEFKKADGNPGLQEFIRQQYAWYNKQIEGAGSLSAGGKTTDPQVQRLQKQLDERTQSDKDAFVAGLVENTNKHMTATFTRDAEVYFKQLNLNDAQKQDLMDSAQTKLSIVLENDPVYKKQLAAYGGQKSPNAATVNAFIQSTIDAKSKKIIDDLVTARYGGMRRKSAPAPAGQPTTDNGATRVAQAPDRSQWDMNKMESLGYENTVKKGIFHLQGGRQVQVVRQ